MRKTLKKYTLRFVYKGLPYRVVIRRLLKVFGYDIAILKLEPENEQGKHPVDGKD